MLRLELKASTTGPGYALITVIGWNQPAASIELSVQRNQDGRFLDESGAWTTNPVWHDVSAALETLGDNLGGEMGPWLVDPLMQNPQVAYMLELRGPDHKDKGVLRISGQILSSQAAGNSLRQETRARHDHTAPPVTVPPVPAQPVTAPPVVEVTPTPEPTPPPVTPPQVVESVYEPTAISMPRVEITTSTSPYPPHSPVEHTDDQPAPALPEKKRSTLPLIIGLVAMLVALIGGAAWFLLSSGIELPGASSTDVAGLEPAGPCGADAMQAGDLAFVQGCLKSAPTTEQLLGVIAAAKAADHCSIVQRLYAHKAQSGDARIAMAYAREYDPDTFEAGGCVKSADAETAAYWYEIAVANDATNTEAKQRLEQLGK